MKKTITTLTIQAAPAGPDIAVDDPSNTYEDTRSDQVVNARVSQSPVKGVDYQIVLQYVDQPGNTVTVTLDHMKFERSDPNNGTAQFTN